MGARNLTSESYMMERDVLTLFGNCVGNGASDPTALKGKGIASIAHVGGAGSGTYTITLTDKWNGLLFHSFSVLDATSPAVWAVTVSAQTVSSSKTISINVFKAGVAADLTSDEKLYFKLQVSNSAQTPAGY